MTILLGVPEDPPLAAVHAALLARGAPCVLVDQREIERFDIELQVACELRGTLRADGRAIDLHEVHSIFLRPYALEEDGALSSAAVRKVAAALSLWADAAAPLAVNRPSAMASNCSKPYQLELIRQHGFRVPETIITTDPAFAREFWERHGRVIYKSLSSVRSIVAQLTPERACGLADVAHCPTQFQEFIAGVEHRVHVIGHRVFATRIDSQADDYRYSDDAAMTACDLPAPLAERCIALAHGLGLAVAGIDLRHTAEDEWICFEVNPSPGFTCFESGDGGEMATAIAALLAHSHAAPGSSAVVKDSGEANPLRVLPHAVAEAEDAGNCPEAT